MNDLIFVTQPEDIRLIRVDDRAQPDFCEICGNQLSELFWTGRYMSCVPCDKDVRKLRKLGVVLPERGITVAEFIRRMQTYVGH